MINQLVALIVDESKWLTASMGFALLAVTVLGIRRRSRASDAGSQRLAGEITLLALGVHNLPLAAPGFLNIGYHLHSGRVVGWAIAGIAVVVNVGLFIGSVIFLASGQSFEQFRGVQ